MQTLEGSRQRFAEQMKGMERKVAEIEANERTYVYSLIGVASAIVGYAMYRLDDLIMVATDLLFFVGLASSALSFLAGYLVLRSRLVSAQSDVWSQGFKLAMTAEEILNPSNPNLEAARKTVGDFVRDCIDKPGELVHRSAQFWLRMQPLLLVAGCACIALWCIAIEMAV